MKLWAWWITVLAIIVMLMGILLTILGVHSLFFPASLRFLSVFYKLLPKQSANNDLWWTFLIYGLFSVGNGSFLIYVAFGPFIKIAKWAWLAVFISVMFWFTMGASISILFLIYVDMTVYSTVLILTLLPLLFTQKTFIIRRDFD